MCEAYFNHEQINTHKKKYQIAKKNALINIEKEMFKSNRGLPKLILGKEKTYLNLYELTDLILL